MQFNFLVVVFFLLLMEPLIKMGLFFYETAFLLHVIEICTGSYLVSTYHEAVYGSFRGSVSP